MQRRRVLVTRAAEDAPALVAALEAAGYEAVLLPLIARQRVLNEHLCWPAVQPDWIVTTSPAATEALQAACLRHPTAHVAVVGETSAKAARAAGIVPTLVGSGAGAAALLDALDAAKLLDASRDARVVLWLRGDRALPDLRDGLRARGALVEELVVYATQLLQPARAAVHQVLQRLHATVFTSPSTVEALVAAGPTLADCGLTIASGAATAAALAQAGFSRTIQASGPSPHELVEALVGASKHSP